MLNFALALRVFAQPTLELPDPTTDMREVRSVALVYGATHYGAIAINRCPSVVPYEYWAKINPSNLEITDIYSDTEILGPGYYIPLGDKTSYLEVSDGYFEFAPNTIVFIGASSEATLSIECD